MEQSEGLDRVRISRPRPAYKGAAEHYKQMATGFAIFALTELVVIAYLARALLAR